MLKKLLASGLFLCTIQANADCGVKSFFPMEPMNQLYNGKTTTIKTKHYHAIANETAHDQSYNVCRRLIMKGSQQGEFYKEECTMVGLKGFKAHTEIIDMHQPVIFYKQGQHVDITIDTWIESTTCKQRDTFHGKLPVF